MNVGVLGLQGAFSEHADAVRQGMARLGVAGEARVVRRPEDLARVDGLVVPGGESTTISKLLRKFGLHEPLARRVKEEEFPVMGTCAGAILLASEGDAQVEKTETRLLGLMDMQVDRNAFGRQRESFEARLDVKGLAAPFPAVFIRAPAIVRTWGRCEAISTLHVPEGLPGLGRDTAAAAAAAYRRRFGADPIVAARQGNLLALAFHPELTGDVRLHEMFLEIVRAWR